MPVEVVHWNPRKRVIPGPLGKLVPWRRAVNNFGDILGPLLVERVLVDCGASTQVGDGRLVTVGSIMHLAETGDVVWGTGINGKKSLDKLAQVDLDIRAVRGPVTRRILTDMGKIVPAVYGDPALLWSKFWPRETYTEKSTQSVGIVPNLHDWSRHKNDPRAINPVGDVHDVIGQIARCDFIIATSLHGIVIAESFGIPARLIPPTTEPIHKYLDYYGGTGRRLNIAANVDEAIEIGGEAPLDWDAAALLNAFPFELWTLVPNGRSE